MLIYLLTTPDFPLVVPKAQKPISAPWKAFLCSSNLSKSTTCCSCGVYGNGIDGDDDDDQEEEDDKDDVLSSIISSPSFSITYHLACAWTFWESNVPTSN